MTDDSPTGRSENMREIGEVCNYYGSLNIKKEDEWVKNKDGLSFPYIKYYWAIENYNGFRWSEIPKYLYDDLMKFEDERVKR